MTERRNNGTGNATSSGGNTSRTRGNTAYGKPILGKLEELGDLIFKYNTKDQADMYLRTTEAIADYVGVEYGREMRMLVKRGVETTFTEPDPPENPRVNVEMEMFKAELAVYHRERSKYKENKAKVFVVVLGQCSQVVKSNLESDDDFADLEQNDDVVGLMAKLKEMAFSTAGIQDPFWNLQNLLRRLTVMNQGTSESVTNYHKRFLASTQVIEAMWGMFVPTRLVAGDTDDDKKNARDKLLAMFFLAGADKKRFGKLVEDLNNAYLSGKDNYPESIESTLTLLTHYQDHKSGGQNAGENDNQLTANFAQGNRRVRCFECNQFGHFRRDCPRRRQQVQAQQEEVDDEARSARDVMNAGWAS